MKMNKIAMAAGLAAMVAAGAAQAQTSSVTLYGSLDQYLMHLSSSSGKSFTALEDGEFLRSRFGFKGREDLGGGLAATFNLETGLYATTGAQNDGSRLFDRQAWVGLADASIGEFRMGRQNGTVFYRGDYVDYTTRTLGSVVNTFAVPTRYDNDLSFRSIRFSGVEVELHATLPGTGTGVTQPQQVFQSAIEYLGGPVRVGYAGAYAKPPAGAKFSNMARYDMVYGNYEYLPGSKIYAVYVRSNDSTCSKGGINANGSCADNTANNNTAGLFGTTGALMTGADANVNRFFNIYQLSADYKITPQLKVGALFGRITQSSNTANYTDGAAIGAYYALSNRTQLIASTDTLRNHGTNGFNANGSAGVQFPSNFNGLDVNGKTINSYQFGIQHKF